MPPVQYDTGQHPPVRDGVGSYDTGEHPPVPYDTGEYPPVRDGVGSYDTGQYPPVGDSGNPPYDPGRFGGRQGTVGHLPGQADGGRYGSGRPEPYDTEEYGAGEYGVGSRPSDRFSAEQYGTGSRDAGPPQTDGLRTDGSGSEGPGRPLEEGQTPSDRYAAAPQRPAGERGRPAGPGPAGEPEVGYETEEFAFVEEDEKNSEDVIDWLKFTESRTERREEARRRGRNRVIALVVVLTLALVGGLGYLWQSGKLPGLSEETDQAASAADTRHVIVIHLRELESGDISTALLVNNETAGRGTTVLLPNSLALKGESGETTTLGKAFAAEGAGATRDSLNDLLGSNIEGTWRLDTPYLENLVELAGGITLDSDATVPSTEKGEKALVRKGADQELDGRAAVAYATYREAAEPQTKQLARFGQVLQAVLGKVSTDKEQATTAVESLGQILDFSLTEAELGAALAALAKLAKDGDHKTELLPVAANGTLTEETSQGLVKEVLGGSVRNTEPGDAVRLAVRNATGQRGAADGAGVTLVNGGFTVVSTGAADAAAERSTVTYSGAAHQKQAVEAAKTLGLSEKAVKKGEGAANADVTIVLGKDYSD
ncbi:LCP family protein [Streptomyces sp. XM4193]|uniref:LCP family protein n=1 Tax=Streptomyces sp. XM4193 TaxID=2929782 RepID=UPI0024A72BE6